MIIKVLLPCYDIPNGQVVSKSLGSKQFVLKSELHIRGGDYAQTVKAPTAGKFLVPVDNAHGDIEVVGFTSTLRWDVEEEELLKFLLDRADPQHAHTRS